VEVYPLVGLSLVLASALNGISILRAWFRIFTGVPLQSSVSLKSQFAERFAVVLLALLILGGGLWPQPGVASRHHAAKSLMDLRHQRATVAGSQAVETMATGRKRYRNSVSYRI
jgi:NADH-quinone oxidoreductase subunit M